MFINYFVLLLGFSSSQDDNERCQAAAWSYFFGSPGMTRRKFFFHLSVFFCSFFHRDAHDDAEKEKAHEKSQQIVLNYKKCDIRQEKNLPNAKMSTKTRWAFCFLSKSKSACANLIHELLIYFLVFCLDFLGLFLNCIGRNSSFTPRNL